MSSDDDADSSSRGRRKKERRRKEDRHRRGSRSPVRKHSKSRESKKRRKRSKSRRRSYSSSSSSSSSSASSASSSHMHKKRQRKSKHSKKRKQHHRRDAKCSRSSKSEIDCNDAKTQVSTIHNDRETNHELENNSNVVAEPPSQSKAEATVQTEAKAKGPMTQAQYLQLQSQVREVLDPATGRFRLVRGTGEIIERIVSRNEHQHLNALATRGDGDEFAKDIARQAMLKRMGR